MKDFLQGLLLFAILTMVATRSDADPIASSLEQHFEEAVTPAYIGYESVQLVDASTSQETRFLVMEFETLLASNSLQHTVHKICQTVLHDIPLVTQLSYEGYDMVSVSFDRNYQYDCL